MLKGNSGQPFPKNTAVKGVDPSQTAFRSALKNNGVGPVMAPGAKDKVDFYKTKYKGNIADNNGVGPVKLG